MVAGEYVSVSSQSDIERADIQREQISLKNAPEYELEELTKIYEIRGLKRETALRVAMELTAFNALESHARDELGINEITRANPFQAAFASGATFIFGGLLPVLASLFVVVNQMIFVQYILAIVFLAILGIIAAKAGGSNIWKAIFRITFWGTIAMGITALIGYLFDIQLG